MKKRKKRKREKKKKEKKKIRGSMRIEIATLLSLQAMCAVSAEFSASPVFMTWMKEHSKSYGSDGEMR